MTLDEAIKELDGYGFSAIHTGNSILGGTSTTIVNGIKIYHNSFIIDPVIGAGRNWVCRFEHGMKDKNVYVKTLDSAVEAVLKQTFER